MAIILCEGKQVEGPSEAITLFVLGKLNGADKVKSFLQQFMLSRIKVYVKTQGQDPKFAVQTSKH